MIKRVDPYPLPPRSIDPYTCQWFIQCGNAPAGTVRHAVLGEVPCCDRCATALRLTLTRPSITEDTRWLPTEKGKRTTC